MLALAGTAEAAVAAATPARLVSRAKPGERVEPWGGGASRLPTGESRYYLLPGCS